MTSSLSTYEQNKIAEQLFRGVAYVFPTTLYLAAFSVAPTVAGGGTELAGNGYARVAVVCNTTNWGAAAGGVIANLVTFSFPQATADWPTVVAIGVFDAATGGNLIAFVSTPTFTSKTVQNLDTLQVPAGLGTFTISPGVA